MAEDSEQEKYYRELREEKIREREQKKTKGFFSSQVDEFKSAFGKGTGATFKKTLSTPLRPFAAIFSFILRILGVLLGLLLAIMILIFLFNFLSGGGVSIFGTQLSVLSSSTSGIISSIVNPVYNFVTDPIGTVASYGSFKNPQTIEKSKPQGVEFKNFKTRRDIHRENDKIETIANVKVYALEDSSTNVDFSCSISDPISLSDIIEATKLTITGQEDSANSVTILKNQDKNFNVLCEFPPKDTGDLNFGDNINREKILNQKITLKANYKNFVVNSRLKVYVLDEKTYSDLEQDNINPFNHFKINDPLISSDKSVRSEQLRKGPIILSLNILDEQPLTESRTYILGIQLLNDKLSWNGKLSKLSNLKLIFPENFNVDLEDCSNFKNDPIKKGVFDLNNPLDKGLDKLELFCGFSIDSLGDEESLTFSLINAEAQFNYEFEAYTTATISPSLLRSTIT